MLTRKPNEKILINIEVEDDELLLQPGSRKRTVQNLVDSSKCGKEVVVGIIIKNP